MRPLAAINIVLGILNLVFFVLDKHILSLLIGMFCLFAGLLNADSSNNK